MAYAYWKSGKVNDKATFDLFIRKNPFQGEFTIFAGLEECLKFVQNFHYSHSDINYLKETLPGTIEPEFFEFLGQLTTHDVVIYAIEEGSVVFPRVPLLRVEGPLISVQLLETTFLTLVNYASLMATNAARYRIAAGKNLSLLEFGLRRAQGPDGGLSASKYAYIGGFDGTSNVLAGKLFNIPVKGTHAHAYITSFTGLDELKTTTLAHNTTGEIQDMLTLCTKWRNELSQVLHVLASEASDGEMAAWISFAIAFPSGFLALVDTYDVRRSGLLNFCAVALSLNDLGYRAVGIRIDSGDLAYLSKMSRQCFKVIAEKYNIPWFAGLTIIASNDINEDTIISLNEQGHSIDSFGIGTHLGHALIDLLQRSVEPPPEVGQKVLCRHPFQEAKRAYVIPTRVEPLYKMYWQKGNLVAPLPTLEDVRQRVQSSLQSLRNDHKRNLNPTPYKVSVSDDLYSFIHDLWLQNAPIGELS
uniref:Nicotinate phosphoribosyltransferase n=1 Tax=Timema californicum TaxID=61474 RepID=A0A7R9J631_TIMCA|nr:unnamed protein product [Timema californicum]